MRSKLVLGTLAFLLVLTVGSSGWAEDYALVAAHEKGKLKGPGKSRGAVIWNHGEGRAAEHPAALPLYLEEVRDAGYDVLRMTRPSDAKPERISAALAAQGRKLKEDGYKTVFSAGQGLGAWIAMLAAARESQPFDGVLSMAPSAHGELGKSEEWQKNANELYEIAQNMATVPVFVGLFANDNHDPGGRGAELRRIFEAKGQPHALIDRPPDLTGHNAANGSVFSRYYGDCVASFLRAAAKIQGNYACKTKAKALKDGSGPALSAGLGPPPEGGGFLGRWEGMLENKRPVLVQVESIEKGHAEAVYAWGAIGGEPGKLRMTGTIKDDLMSLKGEKIIVEMHLLDDDQAQIKWMRQDGRFSVLGRLERSRNAP